MSSGAIFQSELLRWLPRELSIDTAGHDVTHTNVIVAVIQHRRLAETVQSKFGSVVAGAAGKWIFSSQAADIDDPAARERSKRWSASRLQ